MGGDVVSTEIQTGGRSWDQATGNIISTTNRVHFTPRFTNELAVGTVVGIDTHESVEFFKVVPAPKLGAKEKTIYVERTPAPEDAQKLMEEGRLFFPSNGGSPLLQQTS